MLWKWFVNRRATLMSVGVLSSLSLASAASASPFVHFDINFLTISAVPTLTVSNSANYTGTITLQSNGSSMVEGLATGDSSGGGETAYPVTGVSLTALAGTLVYSNGVIVPGGSALSYTMTKAAASLTYTGAFDQAFDTAGNSNIDYSFTTPNNVVEFDTEEDAAPSGVNMSSFDGINMSQYLFPAADSDVIISDIPASDASGYVDVYMYSVPEPSAGLLAIGALAAFVRRGRRAA